MARKKKRGDDERCESCEMAVAIGSYLRICKKVNGKKKCNVLMDKISEDEITPDELFKIIRKNVKKGSKEAKALDEIDGFIREQRRESGKGKKKKKR